MDNTSSATENKIKSIYVDATTYPDNTFFSVTAMWLEDGNKLEGEELDEALGWHASESDWSYTDAMAEDTEETRDVYDAVRETFSLDGDVEVSVHWA